MGTPDYKEELRRLAYLIDEVLEFDEPHRVAKLMAFLEPILKREFGGISGWGSELAARGFRFESTPHKISKEF